MKITIFTPTYNRSTKLKRLYDSLSKQTIKSFEWLIIDDGSTDNTKELVFEFMQENRGFEIRYFFKENGGKHTAYNMGVEQADGNLFMCVDSDDYLEDVAIQRIVETWNDTEDVAKVGIVALKADSTGKILSDRLPKNIESSTLINLPRKYQCRGEFSLIYLTKVLREYMYPVVIKEKFMNESIIYDQLDQVGKLYLLDEILTICEYCDDGYSNNFLKVVLENPTGYKLYYKQRIDMAITIKEKIGYILRYHAFRIMSKDERFGYVGRSILLVHILKPLGFLAYLLYERKKRKL